MRKTTIKTNMKKQVIMTVEEAVKRFEKHNVTKNLAKPTVKYYKCNTDILMNIVGAESPIAAINIETIEELIYQLQAKEITVTSINSCLRATRSFLYFCMERGYVDAFKIKLLKDVEKIKEPYSEEELKKLLRKPMTHNWTEWRNWAMVNYLVSTGNRIQTIINLKLEDIDFINKTIKLTTTKNKKQSYVPMSKALEKVLKEYLSLWEHDRDSYLFPNCEGIQLTDTGLKTIVRKYNISRGISKTSIHLFRHTFAKMYILNGGGMMQLQKLLGHSTLDMTRKYVNLYGTDLAIDYDKFNPLDNLK